MSMNALYKHHRCDQWVGWPSTHLEGASFLGEIRCRHAVQGLCAGILTLPIHKAHRIHISAEFQGPITAVWKGRWGISAYSKCISCLATRPISRTLVTKATTPYVTDAL